MAAAEAWLFLQAKYRQWVKRRSRTLKGAAEHDFGISSTDFVDSTITMAEIILEGMASSYLGQDPGYPMSRTDSQFSLASADGLGPCIGPSTPSTNCSDNGSSPAGVSAITLDSLQFTAASSSSVVQVGTRPSGVAWQKLGRNSKYGTTLDSDCSTSEPDAASMWADPTNQLHNSSQCRPEVEQTCQSAEMPESSPAWLGSNCQDTIGDLEVRECNCFSGLKQVNTLDTCPCQFW